MVRERYGRLCFQATQARPKSLTSDDDDADDILEAGDLYEYAFRVNVGDRFQDVLKALAMASPV